MLEVGRAHLVDAFVHLALPEIPSEFQKISINPLKYLRDKNSRIFLINN